ncbi:MAG: TonB-dependent receptor, partial [Pseudomonadota bacterium]
NGVNDDLVETYSTELSANFQFNRLSGNLGGYYFQSREDFSFDIIGPLASLAPPGVTVNPPETLLTANTETSTRTENFAFYGQLRFELNEKWTLSAGLRYDNESFSTTGLIADTSLSEPICSVSVPGVFLQLPVPAIELPCTTAVAILGGGGGAGGGDTGPQADTFDAFLPKGSITYNFTDDISTFFAVQRGYRAGGTFVQQTTAPDPNGGVPQPVTILGTFDPEFLTNFELGLRSQFLDRTLTVNGSVFFSILDDQQISLPGPTGGVLDFFTDNVGQSQIYGLEVSVDYQPTDELNVYGSLGLLGSEFTDFPFAINFPDSPFFDLDGNEPALAPNVTFTIGGSYNHRSGLFVDGSLNFTGPSESGIENLRVEDFLDPAIPGSFADLGIDPALAEGLDEVSDSRSIVNVRVGYRHENFTLSAFATNLFDDGGLLQQNFASVLPQDSSLNLFLVPNFTIQQPQTFGVQLDVNF